MFLLVFRSVEGACELSELVSQGNGTQLFRAAELVKLLVLVWRPVWLGGGICGGLYARQGVKVDIIGLLGPAVRLENVSEGDGNARGLKVGIMSKDYERKGDRSCVGSVGWRASAAGCGCECRAYSERYWAARGRSPLCLALRPLRR